MDKPKYPRIKVFITKKFKIRASIHESSNSYPYEVTFGGKSWNQGKGRKHETIIKRKAWKIIDTLTNQVTDIPKT